MVYYSYDAAGRTVEVRYPAETAYFAYDALGNRTWMANAGSEVYFTYDALGRTDHIHEKALNKHVYYTYSEIGSRETMTGPEG